TREKEPALTPFPPGDYLADSPRDEAFLDVCRVVSCEERLSVVTKSSLLFPRTKELASQGVLSGKYRAPHDGMRPDLFAFVRSPRSGGVWF
ncbi:MAG: hypothetical protein AAF317_02200, partial [Pseudomonadota bacterium]